MGGSEKGTGRVFKVYGGIVSRRWLNRVQLRFFLFSVETFFVYFLFSVFDYFSAIDYFFVIIFLHIVKKFVLVIRGA